MASGALLEELASLFAGTLEGMISITPVIRQTLHDICWLQLDGLMACGFYLRSTIYLGSLYGYLETGSLILLISHVSFPVNNAGC